jgi:hypothetical protein
VSAPTQGLWSSMRKYSDTGTSRTLPDLARQLEHERAGGGYRTREQQAADEAGQTARGDRDAAPYQDQKATLVRETPTQRGPEFASRPESVTERTVRDLAPRTLGTQDKEGS